MQLKTFFQKASPILKKYKFSLFCVVFFLPTVRMFCNVIVFKKVYGIIVDNLQNKQLTLETGAWLFVVYILARFTGNITRFIFVKNIYNVDVKMKEDIKSLLFNILVRNSTDYFNKTSAGDLSVRVDSVITNFVSAMNSLASIFAVVLVFIIIDYQFFNIDSKLAIVFLVCCVVLFITMLMLSVYTKNASLKRTKAEILAIKEINDCFINISTIKIFAKENEERANIKKSSLKILSDSVDLYKVNAITWFLTFAGLGISSFVFLYLCLEKMLEGSISTGNFIFLTSGGIDILVNIRVSIDSLFKYAESVGKIESGISKIDITPEIIEKDNSENVILNEAPSIVFENVLFGYDKKNVFENLNLTIKKGEKIGVVGKSGGGKTTFVKLLLRLQDIQAGNIKIDNYNLNDFKVESLRKNIAYIPQDTFLFNRTVRENLVYSNNKATNDEVVDACKKAKCYDFITQMENGFDTIISEGGQNLSGGQRKRLIIARAMLKHGHILVLDETTAALDVTVEQEIVDILNEFMEGKTVIVIAHRLNTLKNMDKIVVFDDGKIIEEGGFDELVKRGGVFNGMLNIGGK
ncbi:MAG: ABC transporter ATP-binding protein/permease [Rickettsiales bacterium]|jgi:ATP-binding cassette subfamily B protein|nr:ABC transporter ATP-binding protein/permease [Rickettsiales bacterium]